MEFYRADLTDLPFCFGDTCFYLVSKFADLPMADMLKPGTQWIIVDPIPFTREGHRGHLMLGQKLVTTVGCPLILGIHDLQ